jgi:hypothetical protein
VKHSCSSHSPSSSPEAWPVLSFLADGVFRLDATALFFRDCEVTRHPHLQSENRSCLRAFRLSGFAWLKLLQLILLAALLSYLSRPFRSPVPVALTAAFPRFLHPRRYQVLVDAPLTFA